MPPYTPDPKRWAHYAWRLLAMFGAIAFCFIYGAAFCMFAPGLLVLLLAPLGVILALAIWSLPDSRAAPIGQLGSLFFIGQASTILWPNYLSIALPGMPWISVTKIDVYLMNIALLICVSTSRPFRQRLAEVFRNSPAISRMLLAFFVLQVALIAVSKSPFGSINGVVVYQVLFTSPFIAGAYFFSREGAVTTWSRMIWICAVVVCLIAIPESFVHHPLWQGHIPSFIQTDLDAYAGVSRGGDYRAQSTFDGSIQLAEFLAMATGFVIHETMLAKRLVIRALGAASLLLIVLTAVLSGSRSGLVGIFLAPLIYSGFWVLNFWRRRRDSVLAATALFGFPAAAMLAVAMTFVVPALKYRIWNRSTTYASTEARKVQWSMAIPKIAAHPWGYGAGQSGQTLQYVNGDGALTVDSYMITALLDYGVIGAGLWFGVFAWAIFRGGREIVGAHGLGARGETSYLAPAVIALANFLIIKLVFSQMDSHALFHALLGMVLGLLWRRSQAAKGPNRTSYAATPLTPALRAKRGERVPALV
jgi:hypothetical protein